MNKRLQRKKHREMRRRTRGRTWARGTSRHRFRRAVTRINHCRTNLRVKIEVMLKGERHVEPAETHQVRNWVLSDLLREKLWKKRFPSGTPLAGTPRFETEDILPLQSKAGIKSNYLEA